VQPKASDFAQVKRLDPQNPLNCGFIVAFGKKMTNDPNTLSEVIFGSGQIDDNTFQVFLLSTTNHNIFRSIEYWAKFPKVDQAVGVPLSELIPVRIDALTASGRVVAATELPPDTSGLTKCNGAGVVFNPGVIDRLKGQRLQIELKTDFMFDLEDDKRPIDGNFLLGRLPTGDQVPGGAFWSWVRW